MEFTTLILGAGAAGMFCAAHAGPGVLIVDHAKAPGEKIRISGGGRCNFTNTDLGHANFICTNPHFHKSALARYTPWDFVDLLGRHGIAWHEKTLGQLFCDGKATQIVTMLRDMMAAAGAELWLETEVGRIVKVGNRFRVTLRRAGRDVTVTTRNLVVATGGKSIPKMGATGLGYRIAADFDVPVTETRPGLVPFTFPEGRFAPLAGIATPVVARAARGPGFAEAMLFTHRGLSGPAILQVSSYWREGEPVSIGLGAGLRLAETLKARKKTDGRKNMTTVLATLLPGKLVTLWAGEHDLAGNLAEWANARIDTLVDDLSDWQLRPTGTEGYRTAEVTVGGVDTDALSSQTMAVKAVPGLYFIGECVDVTGWLGGYNFQWAWASAHAAAKAIAESQSQSQSQN